MERHSRPHVTQVKVAFALVAELRPLPSRAEAKAFSRSIASVVIISLYINVFESFARPPRIGGPRLMPSLPMPKDGHGFT